MRGLQAAHSVLKFRFRGMGVRERECERVGWREVGGEREREKEGRKVPAAAGPVKDLYMVTGRYTTLKTKNRATNMYCRLG